MVKRPKSPEPVEDSKFLAVVHPFPLNANMELLNDFKQFMFWLASVVGKDYALGVFFKPSARGIVVADVSKTFTQFEKLLGEHRWGEFLREPSSEERDRKTKVYYSTYTNSRALQKDGWKYLLADDQTFSDFRQINKKVKHPYPPARWCEPHYEDPTSKPVCRPLPNISKAPPPRAVGPVPGSSTWINKKSGAKGVPGAPPNEPKGGPAFKGTGHSQAVESKGKSKAMANPEAWKTPITPAAAQSSPIVTSPPFVTPKTAWNKPLSSASMSISSTTMSTPRSASPATATAGDDVDSVFSSSLLTPTSHKSFDDFPPGLGPPGLSPLIPKGRPTNPIGSSAISTLQRQFAPSSISNDTNSIAATVPESGYLDDYDDDSEGEDTFEFPTADIISVREEVHYDPASAPRMGKGPGKGRRGQGNVISNLSFTSSSKNQKDNADSKVPQQFSNRTFRKVVDEDPCPVHGVICSKGICSVMKKRRWEQEREEKKKERERKREENKRKKEGKSQPERDERGNVVDESETQEEEDQADEEGEEVDQAASVVNSVPSVADTKSSISESKRSEGGDSTIGKPRKGDWGPKKARNAKARPYLPDKASGPAAPSQVSSSIDNGSLYGTYAPSSHRSIPVSVPASTKVGPISPAHTIKSPPPSVWGASSSSPVSSRGATAMTSQGPGGNTAAMMRKGGSVVTGPTSSTGTTASVNVERGKMKEKWRRPFEPVAPVIKVRPTEQGRKKTWDEMVEEGESELGSIMDFGTR